MREDVRRVMPRVTWAWRRFEALSADDVYDMLALRSEAFVVEQQCSFLDADGCDRHAWHLLGRVDAGRVDAGVEGQSQTIMAPLAAYLRSLDPGVKCPESSIGRVIVASPYRGTGLGRALMHEGIARAQAQRPQVAIRISAQLRLAAFYVSLGFRSEGSPYIEDGIDHVDMHLTVTPGLQSEAIEEKQR